MDIIKTAAEMKTISESIRKEKKVGFVPTMGYLHEGHLALVRKARALADIVVVSIYVNPTQFGPAEDLDKYPRDLDRDIKLLEKERTDIVFFPDNQQIYPDGYSTYIQVRGLEDHLCGKTRKGHFIGVATIVAKLFNIVKPHFAVFGQKDYQQLQIIKRMAKDLDMDVEVVGYPTVREPDGLAMSSRNTYLSPDERERASLISKSIREVEDAFRNGCRDAKTLRELSKKILLSADGINIEYITISDAETLDEIDVIKDSAVLAIACRIGNTRLIDNTILED